MGLISCSSRIPLKDSPKYMSQFGCIINLLLQWGTSALEMRIIGIGPIILRANVEVPFGALKSTSLLDLLYII